MADRHDRIVPDRLSGEELFDGADSESIRVREFWSWAYSDLLNNTERGVLAEFIVARALGVADGVRENWTAYDLKTKSGLRVEVKSSAYVQSWHQKTDSEIQFKINATDGWDPATGASSGERRRQADVYVFCVLKSALPLNLSDWLFLVLPTSTLPDQGTINLNPLRELGAREVPYSAIADAIESAVS